MEWNHFFLNTLAVVPRESDPAVVYSTVRTKDGKYGQIGVRPKKTTGKAALYFNVEQREKYSKFCLKEYPS